MHDGEKQDTSIIIELERDSLQSKYEAGPQEQPVHIKATLDKAKIAFLLSNTPQHTP
jgi:hypothetical protein